MEEFVDVPTKTYSQLRYEIQSGDILLCSGNTFFSNLIKQATKSIWSHVAFVLKIEAINRIMVLESVESIGVRAVTLSSYINDYDGSGEGYPGHLMIARHQDMKQKDIKDLSKIAVDLLGHRYNTQEVIRIATRISLNQLNIAMPEKNKFVKSEFICSEYVYECFKSIGIDVQFDRMGFIAPADFAHCDKISPIAFVDTEVSSKIRVPQLEVS